MITFENTEVFNLDGAIRGMRNSWESWEKSDSRYEGWRFVIGQEDFELAMKLSKAGSDHAKFLRRKNSAYQIHVATKSIQEGNY